MTSKRITLIFSFFLLSCQSYDKQGVTDLVLVDSNSEFVTEDGGLIDAKYESLSSFKHEYLQVKYRLDTIYAEAILNVNACGEAKGHLEVHGDTLYLTSRETSQDLCTSTNWKLFRFWIKNPANKRYKVVQY